ncbi:MAG: hypothetical protein K9N11_07770 [Lentisphaeria bacterium]|nr:hypothetical protein [Candidatus Neomarinimicrobiota bacterium]MCF7842734.1 hypothetical protein [Lentisphaeria bacterium]
MSDTNGILPKLEKLEAMAGQLQKNFKRLENQLAVLEEEINDQSLETPHDDREIWEQAVKELSARVVDLEKSVTKLIRHAHTHE